MRQFAVLSAVFDGHNAGMLSVDYAIHSLVHRLGAAADVTFYTLVDPDDAAIPASAMHVPLRYRRLIGNAKAVLDSDAIVFAGDFFHARHYHAEDVFRRLSSRRVVDRPDQAAAICHEYFLLTKAPAEVLARTFIVGGSLLGNRQSDYADGAYRDGLARLLRGARRVLMRDVHSAFKVACLRGHGAGTTLGVDCAMLLHGGDVERLARSELSVARGPGHGRRAGVFLSRTRGAVEDIWSVVVDLCIALGATPEWLPWNDLPRNAPWRQLPPQVLPGNESPAVFWGRRWTLGDLLHTLARYPFVITDTYHLCVHAWRAGVPAVCIVRPDDYPGSPTAMGRPTPLTVSEDKKVTFCSMYDARDFVVSLHQWRDPQQRQYILEHVSRIVGDSSCVDGIVQRIRDHSESVESDLAAELVPLAGGRRPK